MDLDSKMLQNINNLSQKYEGRNQKEDKTILRMERLID